MSGVSRGERLHLALIGRTNVGKSTFLNFLAGQDVALTSPLPGTTTDVVEKSMELSPLGPVVWLDTPGLEDTTELGPQRMERTRRVFDRADIVVLLREWGEETPAEIGARQEAERRQIPVVTVYNKADVNPPPSGTEALMCSALDTGARETFLARLKTELLTVCPESFLNPPALVGDLLPAGGLMVLVVPIDLQAPKGRLIVPQVQALRDALDHDSAILVVKEREYASALDRLKDPPSLVVCDSQVVLKMVADTPDAVPCTTFSILMARMKGDLAQLAEGAAALDHMHPGDRILISESCSHHALEDDIGRVKIPRWIRQYAGVAVEVESCAGRDFPENLQRYRLVVQCGGCMHNRRTMLTRIEQCRAAGVPITNYGVCIAKTQGVLRRVLSPFPFALLAYDKALARAETSSR